MKTQMQIVQEAIARLERMSREEFVQTLVSSGLADPEPDENQHQLFFRSVSVVELVEVRRSAPAKDVYVSKSGADSLLSFAF
ncbi:TPA: hypothetical protein MYV55_000375 [Klebsiella aerogenes]|uniref:hypothetical protein n=1 Tax=Klebsiella aerogenes TaxID=548 RepID=UPI00388EBCBA|nr:hypothetical protein [Klebsiella aerogenes]HCM1705857.1 hypothetical protein [Klebsiella aerogenes]